MSCVTRHGSPWVTPEGGVAVPHAPHSPFSPCRVQGPSSASAWQGAWPPVPTCPHRTPAPSATPLSTGKGAAGTGLSPECPLTPQGWPVVVTVAGHSVPVGGRDVRVCLCWHHGGPEVSLWLASVPVCGQWCHHGWSLWWPTPSLGTGSPVLRPCHGCCMGRQWLSPAATVGCREVALWVRETSGGHLTLSLSPRALQLSQGGGPPHVKLTVEWDMSTKER